MSHSEEKAQDWQRTLVALLDRLPIEERYRCAAGIPGPFLEMRSGTLPRSWDHRLHGSSANELVASVTGLRDDLLRRYASEIASHYSLKRVVRRYGAIAADTRSRCALMANYAEALFHRRRGRSIYDNSTDRLTNIRLRINAREVTIVCPANIVSTGLIWEVFGEEAYRFDEPVPRIYDFGANIGLSAVYFHAVDPGAHVVCVEPMAENIDLLKRNLRANGVPATVVPSAVGRTEGRMSLFYGKQSHALPSLTTKQEASRQISVLPADKIVEGCGYGLKVDIEGAEECLADFPSIVENAAWIVGELHYGADRERNGRIDAFFDLVKRTFDVKKGRPVIYFVGGEVLLCESFKTVSKVLAC
jgi:FkbM family methyltransferase